MKEKLRDAQTGENATEIEADELREFLAVDLFGAPVDPKFKEELRQALWDLVQSRPDRADTGGNRS